MMNLLELQESPEAFRAALLIDTDSGPRQLSECLSANAWQRQDFEQLDSGWKRAIGQAVEGPCYSRAFLERPRGHSKTLDLAIMASWALFASRRRLSLIGCAADQDQARLLRDAIGRLVYVNPWLDKVLVVENYRVKNPVTESTLDIISSDAKTSYGLTPDAVICDEVVHWKSRDLWDSILSSAAKRAHCMLCVITNAGLSGDWQFETREAVRSDSRWYFSRLEAPCASWISRDLLQEQALLLPSIAYRRLWENQWGEGGGDALASSVIDAAFFPNLLPQSQPISGYEYVGGLDLGVSRDCSALCILGVKRSYQGHGFIRLASTKVWRPTKGQKVDLAEVERTIAELHARFNLQVLNYDPWEARFMASRLQSGGLSVFAKDLGKLHATSKVPMTEVVSTASNLQRLATSLLEAFNDKRVQLYEDADLRRDLSRLRIEERHYGFRLTAPRDATGHGDLGQAFIYAMLAASELAAKRLVVAGAGLDADAHESAYERAWRMHSERADAYAREMEYLDQAGDDRAGSEAFRQKMAAIGRANYRSRNPHDLLFFGG